MKSFTEQEGTGQPPEQVGEPTPEGSQEEIFSLENQREEEDDENEEEAIQWDGSEAELVVDDEAQEFEEQQTGVKLSYSLRPEEVYQCLLHSGVSKSAGKRGIVEAVLLAVLTALFVYQYVLLSRVEPLFFAIVSFLLIFVVLFVPKLGLKKKAKKLADGREIYMEIYPDEIQVGTGSNEWRLRLDGSCTRAEFFGMIVLYPKGHMLILPLRCVEPNVLAEVQAMIISGTEPTGRE